MFLIFAFAWFMFLLFWHILNVNRWYSFSGYIEMLKQCAKNCSNKKQSHAAEHTSPLVNKDLWKTNYETYCGNYKHFIHDLNYIIYNSEIYLSLYDSVVWDVMLHCWTAWSWSWRHYSPSKALIVHSLYYVCGRCLVLDNWNN
jgi:hypothetical protein